MGVKKEQVIFQFWAEKWTFFNQNVGGGHLLEHGLLIELRQLMKQSIKFL